MSQAPVLISATGLLAWLDCKRAAMYRKKWEPIVVPAPMWYGRLFHSMLELHVKKPKLSAEAVVENILEHENEKAGEWGSYEQQDFELMSAKLEAVFPRYLDYWEGNSLDYVAREWRFSIPMLMWDNVILVGFIDGVYRTKNPKGFGVEENKTKGRIEEGQVFELLERDLQTCLYIWATEREHGRCREITFDIARNPGMKMTKKDQSLSRLSRRIGEDIDKRPEHYFHRFEMPVDKNTTQAFEVELEAMCREYADWFRSGMPNTLFGNPCVGRYGMCRYVPICYREDTSRFKATKPYISPAELQIAAEGAETVRRLTRAKKKKKKG